jgi:hypothetical protein
MSKPSDIDDIEPLDPRAYPRSPQRNPLARRPVYIVETEEIETETPDRDAHKDEG